MNPGGGIMFRNLLKNLIFISENKVKISVGFIPQGGFNPFLLTAVSEKGNTV